MKSSHVATTKIYPRILWELVADHFVSGEDTLGPLL